MSGWKESGESAGVTRFGFALTSFGGLDQSSPCSVYSGAGEDMFHAGRESEFVGDSKKDSGETDKWRGISVQLAAE